MLLGIKAEIVLGMLLAMRSRTARIAGGLLLVATIVLSVRGGDRVETPYGHFPAFAIAGTIASAVGSRLMAPGALLAAARQVASRWWVVPSGRMAGGLLVILPAVAVPVLTLGLLEDGSLRLGIAVMIYAAAVLSLAVSLAPMLGSSSAYLIALATVWLGALSTSAGQTIAQERSVFGHLFHMLWLVLPCEWRAERMASTNGVADIGIMGAWIVIGVVIGGWATTAVSPWNRQLRDHT